MANGAQDKIKKYTVKILGEEFTITGNLSRNYVEELQTMINRIGSDISSAYPHLPRRRLWGLTLINLADKYFKFEDKYRQQSKENQQLRKRKKELQQKIDSLQAEYKELSALLEEVDS